MVPMPSPRPAASGGATGGVHCQLGSGLLAAGHPAHPHDRALQSGFVETGTTSYAFSSPRVSCHRRPWAQCPHPLLTPTPRAVTRVTRKPPADRAPTHTPTGLCPCSPHSWKSCLSPGSLPWGVVPPSSPTSAQSFQSHSLSVPPTGIHLHAPRYRRLKPGLVGPGKSHPVRERPPSAGAGTGTRGSVPITPTAAAKPTSSYELCQDQCTRVAASRGLWSVWTLGGSTPPTAAALSPGTARVSPPVLV